MQKVRKEGWIKQQTGRYLKEWRFRYAVIEAIYFKTYKKANCKDQTECIDLTKCEIKYDISKEKQFILEYNDNNKKQERFFFSCSNDKDTNQWIKQIYFAKQCVEKELEIKQRKKEKEDNSYNINLESISDFDREQPTIDSKQESTDSFNPCIDVSTSFPPTDHPIQPMLDIIYDDDDEKLKQDVIAKNDIDIISKLDIMRILINNKNNIVDDKRLLNGLKVLINDCYHGNIKIKDGNNGNNDNNNNNNKEMIGSIIYEWHLLKLNEYEHVIKKYIEYEGNTGLKILHYVLFNTMVMIYKYCNEHKHNGLSVKQILNKYMKLQFGDYKLWRILMEEQYINKQYIQFCKETLIIYKKLKAVKLKIFPSNVKGFDRSDLFKEKRLNSNIMIIDNINKNKKCGNHIQHQYYCTFPAVVSDEIEAINKNDVDQLFLTKIYIAM